MRVLSLNTWHGECKPAPRAFLLSQLETVDVFCLQEASGDAIEEIITTLFADPEFQIAIAIKDGYVSDGYCVYIIAKKPPEWATFLRIDRFLVAPPRFELGTQGSSGLCSTGLSYSAKLIYRILLNLPQLDKPTKRLLL